MPIVTFQIRLPARGQLPSRRPRSSEGATDLLVDVRVEHAAMPTRLIPLSDDGIDPEGKRGT